MSIARSFEDVSSTSNTVVCELGPVPNRMLERARDRAHLGV
jgi:hypothetical protein